MDNIVLVGYIAGTLTTASFVPQVIRAWKMRETRGHLACHARALCIGVILWNLYGIWIGSLPIIAANT